jgi:hypothetical protein
VSSSIAAIQHVRCLRGGSQSQLLRASDGLYYVTKCTNNPQHVRVLANEMMATRLGALLGLPVPRVTTIEVCSWLIENTPELRVDLAGVQTAFQPGLHFASEYVINPADGSLFDYLPESLFKREYWFWINGRETLMAGKRSLPGPQSVVPLIKRSSSIRDIALMLANGISPTPLCVAYMPETTSIRMSKVGMHSSQCLRALKK